MREIRERLQPGQPAPRDCEALSLPFELRQKSRLRARLASGEEVALVLPRGTVLRHGDLLRVDDGRTVRVQAQPERVMHAACAEPLDLARLAYHLGNRHVPLQIARDWLRFAEDDVLRRMVEGLGATVTALEVPFEPEAGAYGAPAHHAEGHGGIIHDHAHEHGAHGRGRHER